VGELRAGVGRAVITPPVGAEMIGWTMRKGLSIGVHDPLRCRALVLDDGQTSAVIVSLEMIGIPMEMTNQVRDLVAAQTAIPRQNILLNCSHTHSSPSTLPGYHNVPLTPAHRNHLQVLPYIIAGAISEAWHRRQPARIGAASTQVHGITVNRRDPSLPVDPQLGVVRIDDAAGRPLACLVNYACHGTSVGPHDLEWTADFAGYVADAVESALPGCAGLFLQGAEGDIHPWDCYFGNAHPRFPDG